MVCGTKGERWLKFGQRRGKGCLLKGIGSERGGMGLRKGCEGIGAL
jgi:hypothetical protein